ncbi:hypothetical protein [uncultured Winogradskyella sp.]|uniref:hypothetical protein n=1 Tax=uncultured Winogradskyella sp. TaxID=395353 RepID=UPI002618823A|nr:hypothetical protein [uncultured Winogradskyella sp.]
MKTKFLTLVTALGVTALMMNSCSFLRGTGSTSNSTSICMNYSSQPMSDLDVGLVHKMTNGYEDNQLTAISRSMPKDSRAMWLDLETIKAYIYHLEINAKKNNIPSTDLGLRFYYASYPEKMASYSDLAGLPNTFERRHTLIAVSTIRKKGIDLDFDPTNPDTYNTGIIGMEEYLDPAKKIPVIGASHSGSRSTQRIGVQNHGNLYPPFGPAGVAF